MTNKLLFLVGIIPLLLVPLINAQLSEKEQADKAIADQNATKLCHELRDTIGNMSSSDALLQMNKDTYVTAGCEDRTGVITK